MRKPDLFDEIILCLRDIAEREPAAGIDEKTLARFYAPPEHKSAVTQKTPDPGQQCAAAAHTEIPAWEALHAEAESCKKCPLHTGRRHVVFGAGNPAADLMFIGEGPGEREDAQGIPFVGRAGELLTRMIAAMGFDREKDVYIANIVKCRPPGNRNPEESEAAACLPYLERQIELVNPKVIVLLGAVPLLYLLKMRGILRLHGVWQNYKGIRTLPTFHPAYLLRSPDKKADAWRDLQIVMREFGHTPPPPRRKR